MKKFLCSISLIALLLVAFCGACLADGLKIAIVTSPNDVHDGGFNEDNYNGLLEFNKAPATLPPA